MTHTSDEKLPEEGSLWWWESIAQQTARVEARQPTVNTREMDSRALRLSVARSILRGETPKEIEEIQAQGQDKPGEIVKSPLVSAGTQWNTLVRLVEETSEPLPTRFAHKDLDNTPVIQAAFLKAATVIIGDTGLSDTEVYRELGTLWLRRTAKNARNATSLVRFLRQATPEMFTECAECGAENEPLFSDCVECKIPRG